MLFYILGAIFAALGLVWFNRKSDSLTIGNLLIGILGVCASWATVIICILIFLSESDLYHKVIWKKSNDSDK